MIVSITRGSNSSTRGSITPVVSESSTILVITRITISFFCIPVSPLPASVVANSSTRFMYSTACLGMSAIAKSAYTLDNGEIAVTALHISCSLSVSIFCLCDFVYWRVSLRTSLLGFFFLTGFFFIARARFFDPTPNMCSADVRKWMEGVLPMSKTITLAKSMQSNDNTVGGSALVDRIQKHFYRNLTKFERQLRPSMDPVSNKLYGWWFHQARSVSDEEDDFDNWTEAEKYNALSADQTARVYATGPKIETHEQLDEILEQQKFSGHLAYSMTAELRDDITVLMKAIEKAKCGWFICLMSERVQLDEVAVEAVFRNCTTDMFCVRREMRRK